MNRRVALSAAAALVATAATHQVFAEGKPEPKTESRLADAVSACLKAAFACREHCVAVLASGDKSMGPCLRTVVDMIPLCEAVGQLAASRSKHLKKAAAACLDACADCEVECRKHEKMSEICKACADTCKACVEACKSV